MPMERPVSPYRPVALVPGMARLCDVLASLAALAGTEALSFLFEPSPGNEAAAASLDFEAGGFVWRLEFFDLDFLRATNEALAETEIRHLPEALREALLLFFLHPYLSRLEKALGTTIHPRPAQEKAAGEKRAFDGQALSLRFTLDLSREGGGKAGKIPRLPLRLKAASGEGADWLAARIPQACPQTRKCPERSGWFLPVILEAGTMRAPLGLLQNLACADILIPPHYPAREGKLALILPGGQGFCVDVADRRAVVTDFLHDKEHPVNVPTPAPSGNGAGLSSLEVTIHFELGKKLLPLAEIEALAPGRTFNLGADPLSAVTLTLNGQALAKGRLVELGGTLGVQITRLLRNPETPNPKTS
jgi:type III secretion protein Q